MFSCGLGLCWEPVHSIHLWHLCGEIWCDRKGQRFSSALSWSSFQTSVLAFCWNRLRCIPHLSSPTQGSKPLTPWWGAFQNWVERDKSTPKPHTSFRSDWFCICCYQVHTQLWQWFPGSTQTQASPHRKLAGYNIVLVQTHFWKFSLTKGHIH